ncbi:SGNH/GDSL hydrolase family protein [Streptomyces sp. P38-E01]|uniref:SGNH/GDSL hydrolase family protein n=1 Tax=Streptomyces tardus TaxID=2780544 RepID=A0A949N550_9ACTN|nr:SGNH/GDSL hydrolase family protein [Streptomyces tardus]MBU7597607.1 SGNH/GDSL hydrolase family protein [Streptomyces tardus]
MRSPRKMLVAAAALTAVAAGLLAAPAAVAGEPAPAAAEKYVALGDSYATAPGTREYDNPDDECRRGPLTYSRLYAAENPSMNFVEASCSGATAADLLTTQVPQLTADTTRISVQAGGNDVGFVEVLKNCILTIDDADCLAGVEAAKAAATNALPAALDQTYAGIKSAAPNAKVVVVGYPRLYTIGGDCGILGLSDAERAALNSAADTLATVISGRAEAAGFSYLDPRPAFDPHSLCSGGSEWVTSLEWDKLNESYHPNPAGHREGYLPAIRAALG